MLLDMSSTETCADLLALALALILGGGQWSGRVKVHDRLPYSVRPRIVSYTALLKLTLGAIPNCEKLLSSTTFSHHRYVEQSGL